MPLGEAFPSTCVDTHPLLQTLIRDHESEVPQGKCESSTGARGRDPETLSGRDLLNHDYRDKEDATGVRGQVICGPTL